MNFRKLFLIAVSVVILFSASILAAASQELTAEGNKNLRSANMHLAGERYEKALPLYEGVLEENPHHIEALQKIAAIYYDAKMKYLVAYDYYGQAIKEIEALYAEYEEMKANDKKAAKKFFKSEISKPKYDDALENMRKLQQSCWIKVFNLGQEYYKAEAYDEALQQYNQLLEAAPDSINTYLMLANIHNIQENDEKALEFYSLINELTPQDLSPILQSATILYNNGSFEEAAVWYQKAAELEPENPDHLYNAAICYTNSQNAEQAYKYFVKTLEIDPENLDAALNASNNAAVLGDTENQMKYLKIVIELDPENVDFISYFTAQLVSQKNYAEALEYAEKWLELAPESADAQQMVNFLKNQVNK
ncbi:MAG: tetratricopeptide repeat protein [Candidatus Cloacimonadales bacterium]